MALDGVGGAATIFVCLRWLGEVSIRSLASDIPAKGMVEGSRFRRLVGAIALFSHCYLVVLLSHAGCTRILRHRRVGFVLL